MNDIDKNRPVFTINHIQTAPLKTKGKARSDIAEDTAAWLKDKKNKITKIKTGVSSYTEMSVKAASKMKGKAQLEHNMREPIHCKGCTEREGKPVTHPKSEFTHRSDMTRLFESTCRVEKKRRAKEAEHKRRNC